MSRMRTKRAELADEHRLLGKLRNAIDADRANRTRAALKCGVGEPAVTKWLQRWALPKNRLVREALERFLSGGK